MKKTRWKWVVVWTLQMTDSEKDASPDREDDAGEERSAVFLRKRDAATFYRNVCKRSTTYRDAAWPVVLARVEHFTDE